MTLRTTIAQRGSAGNVAPSLYRPLVLEEWSLATGTASLLQQWELPTSGPTACTLPGLSVESWTEGMMSARYPTEDQVWFLCRAVPANSSLATFPAPVNYAFLNENGELGVWTQDLFFPNGTSTVQIVPVVSQDFNIFYTVAGGIPPGSPTSRPPLIRIRVDSGPGVPPDAQGNLLSSVQGISINLLRILNNTLYGTGLQQPQPVGIPTPGVFQIGSLGQMPDTTRQSTLFTPFPLFLSSTTEKTGSVFWFTGFDRVPFLARENISSSADTETWILPSSAGGSGTLGGVSWSILSGRYEQDDFALYMSNTTDIYRTSYERQKANLPWTSLIKAPQGWRYLSALGRDPILYPSATATATATATPSSSASPSATASWSSHPTSTATRSSTVSRTASASTSASSWPSIDGTALATFSASATATKSSSSSSSASASATATATNGTVPVPVPVPAAAAIPEKMSADEITGISLGVIGGVAVAGLFLMAKSAAIKRAMVVHFGQSSRSLGKGPIGMRTPRPSSSAPLEISHNPAALANMRLEQLKTFKKTVAEKDIHSMTTRIVMQKKIFTPVISGSSV